MRRMTRSRASQHSSKNGYPPGIGRNSAIPQAAQSERNPLLPQQFRYRLPGLVVERVGDLDGPSDRAHVLLAPVDPEELVDRREQVSHGDDAVGDVRSAFVA